MTAAGLPNFINCSYLAHQIYTGRGCASFYDKDRNEINSIVGYQPLFRICNSHLTLFPYSNEYLTLCRTHINRALTALRIRGTRAVVKRTPEGRKMVLRFFNDKSITKEYLLSARRLIFKIDYRGERGELLLTTDNHPKETTNEIYGAELSIGL